jgi:phosphoenolpyruvate carboxykinase (GTP)
VDDRSRRWSRQWRRNTHRHGARKRRAQTDGLKLDRAKLDELLEVDTAAWQGELAAIGEYLETFAPRLPARLHKEQQRVATALDGRGSNLAAKASAS